MRKFRSWFGGGRSAPPAIDYAAIQRQQDAERKRLQDIRDEEFRVTGIKDYIDYMYDNPESLSQRSATGSFYKAISPGKVPTELLQGYQSDKNIKLSDVKADQTGKYFQQRTSVPSIKEGRIKFGKRTTKAPQEGLLGTGEVEKKKLLGA